MLKVIGLNLNMKHRASIFLLLPVILVPFVNALDNGLALKPPLGWLTWERFMCNIDCANDPKNCIGEALIKEMADAMVSGGYRDAGYEYIIIDDCWPAKVRTPDGKLQGDRTRFPSGIKALADYVHSKGLKFGIYEDFGKETCGGFPGSEFYMQMDAETFADWGVDFVKFDQCNSDPSDIQFGYPIMGFFLNKTGRPMLYSCEWPLNTIVVQKAKPDFAAIRKTCNMWRNFNDVQDSWDSINGIINFWASDIYNFSSYHGPGGWNDPDAIIVGDFGLSYDQERVQMGLWCMFAAPLIMSNDLRNIRESSKALLLNKRLLSINQDPLGIQAKLLFQMGNLQIWSRPILPKGTTVIAIVNKSDTGTSTVVSIPLVRYQLDDQVYDLMEAFDGLSLGRHNISSVIRFNVNPTGIFIFVATPVAM